MAKSEAWKNFERETAALAGKDGYGKGYGRRVALSGSIGTTEGMPKFVGDAQWDWPWMDKIISIECKYGYADKAEAKSIRLQKKWFDKHYEQCKAHNLLPMFTMKIKLARQNGLSKFALIPFPVMQELVETMHNMYLELEELKREKNGNN